ncbi:MAG TPA: bifunctional demethylmenaquinone methyltransferase/2-methoxy-6-polyprenyl-1,4-benzoquinol methylase UbiE [Bacteroidales bacterium]|nr:bifunctional demethylmenaquinone methyltransferase/2-methoxy-6-polyprenyl-1,4-benzoquinol methylase UbiE [Bacteroidales bacterium]HPS49746.1 bifunctional demethylmenaquinone methyltransferase/2-methoxy-6-polyprenyl-1,4-benzoquinol methylase UbiE [Bacteroidales bacterium]
MGSAPKKETVRRMFDDISGKYDFLNHFFSFGIDHLWRKKLVRLLAPSKPLSILDVACGTGDLALSLARLRPQRIVGIDISEKMLEIGRQKISRKGQEPVIRLQQGDAEHIPFPDNTFDAVTVAFGVRNFDDLGLGLSEMRRVLRPGGCMLILEFSHPTAFPMKQLYGFYSHAIIPVVGRLISGSSTAYTYLPQSVDAFPSGTDFLEILDQRGLARVNQISLTGGIASVYTGEK